ncbi:MAG: glycosyltransferase family 2 protein [Vampirovibrionales bacterium]|nr:glycosyltransferase family 2 protein [Vampirovibrionales bacterium]
MSYRSQTITAVVLTRDDAKVIERCLDSVKWVDEILVLDAGSTDNTLELARRYTQKIFFHPSDDASTRRNFAFQLAKSDWVLSLDAKEWVEEMLRHEIDGVLLNANADVDGYSIARRVMFQNEELAGDGKSRSIRLFRKGKGYAVTGPYPHLIAVQGESEKLSRVIGYEPFTNLEEWFDTVNENSTLAAYQALEAGKVASSTGVMNLLIKTKWTFLSSFLAHSGAGMNGLTMALAKTVEQYLTQNKMRSLSKVSSK